MPVTDDAIRKIKHMIQTGELRPGDRLPPEQELAAELGLSRSSMREAVKALEIMRVIDVRRGDGTYVTSLRPGLLIEAMSFVLDFHASEDELQVLEARRLLEPQVASLAAERITPEQLAELRTHLDGLPADSDIETLVHHDIDYHRLIAVASGNEYLASLMEAVGSQTVRARLWRGIRDADAADRTLREHDAIYEALAAGDAGLAHAVMLMHVTSAERSVREALNEERATGAADSE